MNDVFRWNQGMEQVQTVAPMEVVCGDMVLLLRFNQQGPMVNLDLYLKLKKIIVFTNL